MSRMLLFLPPSIVANADDDYHIYAEIVLQISLYYGWFLHPIAQAIFGSRPLISLASYVIDMAERTIFMHEMVNNRCSYCDFDFFNRIKDKYTKIPVKVIVLQYNIECCAFFKGVICWGFAIWKEIAAKSIVIDSAKTGNKTVTVSDKATG